MPSSALSTNLAATRSSHSTDESTGKLLPSWPSAPEARPNISPNPNSFEAVMQAMDAELDRVSEQNQSRYAKHDKGKAKVPSVEDQADTL